MKKPTQYFRAGAGAVITDGRGRVLVFERSHLPGAWQFPQGGMDAGEAPLDTAWREVEEETGIPRRALRLLDSYPEPLAYELPERARTPKTGRGQTQYWFLFRLRTASALKPPPEDSEFARYRWVSFETAVRRVVVFKRAVYRRLRERWS
jgi:putative (di)nucleoside polyphosphate hydrolase